MDDIDEMLERLEREAAAPVPTRRRAVYMPGHSQMTTVDLPEQQVVAMEHIDKLFRRPHHWFQSIADPSVYRAQIRSVGQQVRLHVDADGVVTAVT